MYINFSSKNFADDSRITYDFQPNWFQFFQSLTTFMIYIEKSIVLTFKYFVSVTNSHRCMSFFKSFFNRLSIFFNSKSHLALIWLVLSTSAKLKFLSSSVVWIDVKLNIRDIGSCKSTIPWCLGKNLNKTSKTSKLSNAIASKSVVSWAFNISSFWK